MYIFSKLTKSFNYDIITSLFTIIKNKLFFVDDLTDLCHICGQQDGDTHWLTAYVMSFSGSP